MDIRHVVTCFLRHAQQRTLLLGQRSKDVNTYPLHYAGISGSIEDESPRERAHIEIREETGLQDEQIRLVGTGQPIRFPDWDINTLWVVHPFLFECNDPNSVRHDWEHTHLEWVPPENISELDTVPQLNEAWESARHAAAAGGHPDGHDIFQSVEDDRTHGAGELGIWTLEGIRASLRKMDRKDPQAARYETRRICQKAISLRPSMATPLTAGLDAWDTLREIDWTDSKAHSTAMEALDKLIGQREQASIRCGEQAIRLIPDQSHVVTISLSSSVLMTLHEASPSIRLLSVGEARPGCEGAECARQATSFGIDTELMTDSAAARQVKNADVVLIGADSIQAEGCVINKVGSLALFSVAQVFDVTTLVVTTTEKILPGSCSQTMEEMDPDELGYSIPDVCVRNPYFERLPHGLIDHIATEAGELTHQDIEQRAQIRSEQHNNLTPRH